MTTKQNAIAAMVNAMQAGAKAAKAKQAAPSKVVLTLSQDQQIKLASDAGAAALNLANARQAFDHAATQLHQAKAVIGDQRKCKLAKAFIAARFAGKDVAASTKANALAAFRHAVETGKPYDENRKRAEKKAAVTKGASHDAKTEKAAAPAADTKKATHVEASETATTYQCTIARKGSAKKAAQTLRDLINKMKSNEEYAALCSFLIDGLNNFDGSDE